MKPTIEIENLTKAELVTLIRRQAVYIDPDEIRLVRHKTLCHRARVQAREALEEISRIRERLDVEGIRLDSLDWKAHKAAHKKFKRAMGLYDLADRVFGGKAARVGSDL